MIDLVYSVWKKICIVLVHYVAIPSGRVAWVAVPPGGYYHKCYGKMMNLKSTSVDRQDCAPGGYCGGLKFKSTGLNYDFLD